ncbi:hypothetical protein [Metabacillus sediminilitoris]|uniref:hypothetical protein n=1 Tax=Metabacillus sediminilitoris TaxID=2567941 RepID=UPI001454BF58|nr:hypothetical protein [Metabacillus sediminilitoris]
MATKFAKTAFRKDCYYKSYLRLIGADCKTLAGGEEINHPARLDKATKDAKNRHA